MFHFRAQNDPFVLNKIFLVKTIIITFIYLLALFMVQDLKKFLLRILSYENAPFLDPKWSICPQFFFGKSIKSFSSTYQPLLLCKIRSRVMRMRNFLVQNDPFPQMRIFFRKPINEPCFFHSCLSTCQKSKSNINLLVKYWRLKNTEISLAESHFWL